MTGLETICCLSLFFAVEFNQCRTIGNLLAGVKSEVLVLGVPDADGAVVLLEPTHGVPLGGRMF